MKREMYALISMIIVLILILVSFFMPWYSSGGLISGAGMMSLDIYLDRITMKTLYSGDVSMSHGESEGMEYIGTVLFIAIAALITSILALIGILGIHYHFGSLKNMRRIGISFGIVTFIMAIIAIFYFMMGTINTIQTSQEIYYGSSQTIPFGGSNPSFWMNLNVEGMAISAGPGIAWYLMAIAGLITLASSGLILKKTKTDI
ncbi:MAG: hypothetical protein KAW45_07835 [Thermoplasmatales archaeon]|nr:hypothetical protein [Thermoplasmatales archaeon]